MGDFSRADALAFLSSWPAKLAHVSTARNDGSTVTVPVWYRIDTDAEQLLIWTGHERRWVRRVVASGHLSFSVAEDSFPLRGVMGGGPAVVLGDGEIDVDAERARIIERYVMGHLINAYTESRSEYRAILRVDLQQLNGWTFAP